MIEVKNLTKKYGDHYAVDHLSFQVEDGQIYGFLGPNGAGKSTTMNMMTGYLAPTAGMIKVNGFDIMEEPEAAKRTIGYLPELPPVYPDMTVREYLAFCAELKRVPKKERLSAVKEKMMELGIEDMANRLIRNLSKGYKQRVGFAQALLGDPQTLILDEPTVGLDPKQILEIRELIRNLGKKHTVILSSHILSEVSEVCDRVLIINHGRFVACDSPDRLEMGGKGGTTLLVAAEGKRADVLAALRTVVQVTDGDLTEDQGVVSASIDVPDRQDIRGRVSAALFAANCPVVEMRTKKANLEDVFLELTEGEEQADQDDQEQTDSEAEQESPASDKEEPKLHGEEEQKEDQA